MAGAGPVHVNIVFGSWSLVLCCHIVRRCATSNEKRALSFYSQQAQNRNVGRRKKEDNFCRTYVETSANETLSCVIFCCLICSFWIRQKIKWAYSRDEMWGWYVRCGSKIFQRRSFHDKKANLTCSSRSSAHLSDSWIRASIKICLHHSSFFSNQ